MSIESGLRADIVEIGRRMYARGYTASNDGNISASTQAVPAPPKPLWLIPSPINAHRRDTTNTLSVAHAMESEMAARSA